MAARFTAVCRLCGGIRLDDEDSGCKDRLKDLILKYIGVPIKDDDILPKSVCMQCSDKIEQFHVYVDECLNTQIKLAQYVDGSQEEIKVESLDESPLKLIKEENDSFEDIAIKFESSIDLEESSLSRRTGSRNLSPLSRLGCNSAQIRPTTRVDTSDQENYDDAISDDYDCDDSDISVKLKPLKRRKNDSLQLEKSKKKRTQPFLTKYIIFSCYVCEQKYENWYRLKSHISQTHNQLPKVKCICGCFLKSKSAIYRHVAGHNDPSNFACDQCPRITKTLDALKTHKMRHVPKTDRVFQCSSCEKTFSSKENLKSHEKVHIPITERCIFPCNICGNKFTTKSAVVGHVRAVHEKIKRFICDICGYACSTRGELVQHRAIHSEEKQFECKICLKRFKTYSNLKAHIDIHPETSYPCTICGKVLNSRRTWRKHYLVHQDLYQHKCPHCNKSFKRRHTLKMHMVTHTGAKPVKCPWCPQRFSYSSSLRSHKQKLHYEQMMASNGDKEQNKVVQPSNETLDQGIAITINSIVTIIE